MPQPEIQQAEVGQAETPQPESQPEPAMQQPEVQAPAPQDAEMQTKMVRGELPRDPNWTVFREPSLGTSIDLPSAVFSMPDGPAYRGVGRS